MTSSRPRLPALFLSICLALGGLVVLGATPAHAADKDCPDFANQAQAQDYFIKKGGPKYDPDRLDADNDGIACDSLPCPCKKGTTTSPTPSPAPTKLRQWARVTKVVDGDTVDVRLLSNGKVKRVRLVGVNTPEMRPRQCYAVKATRLTKRLLPRGTRVLLVRDTTQANVDRYGRLLRYVHKGKKAKVDVNRRIVVRGAAKVYVYQRNFKRTASYRAAQRYAKAHRSGLWGACRR